MHAVGHTPESPLASGAKLCEGHWLWLVCAWDANPLCMKTGSAEEADESYMINGSEGVTCKACDSSWHIEAHKDYVACHLRKDWGPTEY